MIDVAPGGQHVVDAAVADVVGPAVAADDPDAAPDQVLGRGRRGSWPPVWSRPASRSLQQRRRARAARRCPASLVWSASSRRFGQFAADAVRPVPRSSSRRVVGLLVHRQAQAQAEFGVVLEQRIVPGRAAALRRWRCRGWSAGCRRRSTSSRWRWRPACGRRTAGSPA